MMFPANVRNARAVERASGLASVTVAGVAAAAVLAALLTFISPASAAPSLSVSPSTGLNPSRDFVTVTGRGFKPNIQLFVMQCRSTSGEDHTCNSIGLQKVMTDGNGSFTKGGVMVTARFGATDCTVTPCAIKTSAVQGHSGDRSQDRLAPISFGAAPVSPPVTQAPVAPPVTVVPPVTEPPVTPTTVVAPTTTAAPITSTTVAPIESTTTTTEPSVTTTTERPATSQVAAEPVDTGDGDGGGGGNSAVLVVAIVLAAAAAAGGAAFYLRARSASA
ncbi:MAG: hypothetical protein KDB02_13055 [Acidimicrobiales bacterium]|nr:hypothetical protein [Acidimicrobiales bacterium]